MPRENPRYSFLVDQLRVQRISKPGESWTMFGIGSVNLSKGGIGLPTPRLFALKENLPAQGSLDLKDDDEVEITFKVYGVPPALGFAMQWTVKGKVRHAALPYFGVKITDVPDPDERETLDLWIQKLSETPGGQNPYQKDVLESWGVIANVFGVGCGILGILVFTNWYAQVTSITLMLLSLLSYIVLRSMRLRIEVGERKAWRQ